MKKRKCSFWSDPTYKLINAVVKLWVHFITPISRAAKDIGLSDITVCFAFKTALRVDLISRSISDGDLDKPTDRAYIHPWKAI